MDKSLHDLVENYAEKHVFQKTVKTGVILLMDKSLHDLVENYTEITPK